jgi:hypothetical protein
MNIKSSLINKYLKSFLSYFLIGFVFLSNCKKPTEGINLIINTSSLSKAPNLITFINANSLNGTPLPASFNITIGGPNASLVQASGGKTTFTVINGILPISLTKDAFPSSSNPVIFSINANLPGFQPMSTNISISDDVVYSRTIQLIETSNPPTGVSSITKTIALTNNATYALITIKTDTNTSANSKAATLTLVQGTQFMDASKNIIKATSLQATLVHSGLNNNVSSVLNPRDLNTIKVSGVNDYASFKTVGMLDINIQANNSAEVKSFTKPIVDSMELAKNQINYTTGKMIAVGDTIPLYNEDKTTQVWTYMGTANVVLNQNNNLTATFQATNTGLWGLLNHVQPSITIDYIPAILNFTFTCSDKNITISPDCTIEFDDLTNPDYSKGPLQIQQGYLSGSVINGHNYQGIIYYNNQTYTTATFTPTRQSNQGSQTTPNFTLDFNYTVDPLTLRNTLFIKGNATEICN